MDEYRDNEEEEAGGAVIQEETNSDDIDEEDVVVVVDGESISNDNEDGVFNTSMELTGSDAVNILYHERKRRTWKRLLVGSCVVLVLILVIVAVKKPSQQNQTQQSASGGGSTTTDNPFFQNSDNDDTNENTPTTSTKFLLCDESIQCETDRWGHNQKLKLGHSMCNDQWRFGVGIYESVDGGNKETGTKHSIQGALLWQDCQQDLLLVLQEVNMTTVPKSSNDLAFYMTDTAVFQLLDGTDQVLWELSSTKSSSIVPSQRCLTNPKMDCPYLHIRKNGGNIVLNWISNKNGWDARKVHKVYPGLFPNDFE